MQSVLDEMANCKLRVVGAAAVDALKNAVVFDCGHNNKKVETNVEDTDLTEHETNAHEDENTQTVLEEMPETSTVPNVVPRTGVGAAVVVEAF